MKLDRAELIGALVVGVYILFFAVNPPVQVRTALENPFILGSIVGLSIYVTMNSSKTVGMLLLLAVLISMTSVTEHLTAQK